MDSYSSVPDISIFRPDQDVEYPHRRPSLRPVSPHDPPPQSDIEDDDDDDEEMDDWRALRPSESTLKLPPISSAPKFGPGAPLPPL
jgi:hypothetical protein